MASQSRITVERPGANKVSEEGTADLSVGLLHLSCPPFSVVYAKESVAAKICFLVQTI